MPRADSYVVLIQPFCPAPIVTEIDRPEFKIPSPPLAKASVLSGPPLSRGTDTSKAEPSHVSINTPIGPSRIVF